MVRGVIHDLITRGKVVRGWIGIVPEDISNDQAAQHRPAAWRRGAGGLYQDSPAVEAGLRPGTSSPASTART